MKLIIEGRRWFDRTWGNTYHTVCIRDEAINNPIHISEVTYGYGNQYQQTAKEWLYKNGYNLEQAEVSFRVLDCPKQLLHNWRTHNEAQY